MMQDPGVVAPLVWMFAPDVFPHSPQDVAIEFSIHRLSWWNKFIMHDAFSVKLLPQFLSWFGSKVVKNALHRLLTLIRSGNAETILRFASGIWHYHQMVL
jgi:hypothetical protein